MDIIKFLIKQNKTKFSRKIESRQDHCPDNCLELYKPVCGSDGQVYLNECYLKMQNCE